MTKKPTESWVAEIIGRRDNNTPGLVCSIQQVVKRCEKLRFGRAETEVNHPVTLFDRVFETRHECLAIAEAARTEHLYAAELCVGSDLCNDTCASCTVTG